MDYNSHPLSRSIHHVNTLHDEDPKHSSFLSRMRKLLDWELSGSVLGESVRSWHPLWLWSIIFNFLARVHSCRGRLLLFLYRGRCRVRWNARKNQWGLPYRGGVSSTIYITYSLWILNLDISIWSNNIAESLRIEWRSTSTPFGLFFFYFHALSLVKELSNLPKNNKSSTV